jgi:hypothetical protein
MEVVITWSPLSRRPVMARFRAAVALRVKITLELSEAPMNRATLSLASNKARSLTRPAEPDLPGVATSSLTALIMLSITC